MSRVRIYELAKDLNMDSNEIVEKLRDAGFPVNNNLSSLDSDDLARARDCLSGATNEILEEKRIKPTVIRRRKKVVAKVEEKIQDEVGKVKEEPKPIIKKAVEEETPPIEGKTEEISKIEDEKVLKKDAAPEQKPEPKPEEVKAKPKKKKKEKSKFIPAKIIKEAPVQIDEPKIKEIQEKVVPSEIPFLPEDLPKGAEKKKKGKEVKEVISHKDFRKKKKEIFERVDLYGDTKKGFSDKRRFKKKDKLDKKKFAHTEITTPKAIKKKNKSNRML